MFNKILVNISLQKMEYYLYIQSIANGTINYAKEFIKP